MVIQVRMRRSCTECKGDKPVCPKCGGTGWVEFWADLERLARSIRSGEPITAVVNLDVMIDRFGGVASATPEPDDDSASAAIRDKLKNLGL